MTHHDPHRAGPHRADPHRAGGETGDHDTVDHGGALSRAELRFGRPADGWLDLSTGIAPFAYPVPALDAACWRRLPDPVETDRLRAAAAASYGATDVASVVAAPGSQALIQALARLLPAGQATLVEPTYSEHARCWQRAGHAVEAVAEVEVLADSPATRYGIVVNPNNPDGRRADPALLCDLADRFAARDGVLVVDEAFADLDPELSVARHAGRPGLVVLRSVGKFFGLAGLRLGFALAPAVLARQLSAELGPWPVSGPAIIVGCRLLGDGSWIARNRRALALARAELDRVLAHAGLQGAGGTDLFRLTESPDAPALYEKLGRAGVLVRAFAGRPDWLRFGIPDAQGLERLARVLAS